MTARDIPLGMRLKEQARWNQTTADWQRFLDLQPDGCFVAELDGQPVGTTTTCTFDDVGWIAMVLVDERARHRGVGTGLVQHAVEHLKSRPVRTIRLDATALGRPVYQRLGFVAEYELIRLEGTAHNAVCSGPSVAAAGLEDAEALGRLDQQISATNRRRLLARLITEFPENAAKVVIDSAVGGYVMYRSGWRATQIGPSAASTPEAGRALLDWALARCANQLVYVDIPTDNQAAVEWASSRSMVTQRPFTRMTYGRLLHDQPVRLWASSGPEKG